jgi:hypothetical protein
MHELIALILKTNKYVWGCGTSSEFRIEKKNQNTYLKNYYNLELKLLTTVRFYNSACHIFYETKFFRNHNPHELIY